MSALLAAEWVKLRHRWMVRIIVGLMLAIIALIFWGESTASTARPDTIMPRAWLDALALSTSFAAFLWPILSGNWAGSEYGWGTVRMILSRRPNRIQWPLAALIMLALTGAVALLLTMVVGSIAGLIIAGLNGISAFNTAGLPGDFALVVVKTFLGAWLVLVFYILLAYAAGTLFRSGAFGIGFGIGFTVAELVLYGIFVALGGTWRSFAEHLPYSYTNSLPQRLASEGAMGSIFRPDSNMPSAGEGVIALLIYSAVLLAVTLVLVARRDVTD